jgi:hypothetical protein
MRGRLVQASLDQVTLDAHQGQLGMISARRETPQQRLHGLRLPVERQAERIVSQQPGRLRPVSRRLEVPDGVDDLALPGEPPGGAPVQRRYFPGHCPAQLQPQQPGKHLVVAEPGPRPVERDHERVRLLQVLQDPLPALVFGQQVG